MANEFRVKNGIITPKIISEESDGRVVLTQTATGDDEPIVLAFETAETDIAANDVLGKITFAAPDEGTGTDANLVAAGIQAKSEGDFSSSSNATALEFLTGESEAATVKWLIESDGTFRPSTGNTFDLGAAGEGTINDIHFSSGGRLAFNGSDVTLTLSSNLLTIAGGALTVPTLRYSTSFLSDKEVSSSGAGVKIGENAKFTHIQKPEAIMQHDADVASGDRSWDNAGTDVQTSVFSLNQTNAHVSFNKVEDANSAAEQMYHMCFINLDDDNYSMYGSVEVQGEVQVVEDANGTEDTVVYQLAETVRATWDIAGSRVDMYSVDSHWHHSTGYRPGEFVALKWNDGTSNWMVIAYVNFVAQTNTKINVSAHIRALERPKIIQG
jgi:hypothetical protein